MQWGITAESEYGINVMADDTNFYATPADGSKILFRVPPGGRYYVVTRLPNGTTSMPTTPYQTTTVVNNIRFVAHWDKARRSWITVVTIYPASSYSEYALRAKATHITTLYKRAVNDKVEIESYILYAKDLDILARPIPLQSSEGTNTGTPSPRPWRRLRRSQRTRQRPISSSPRRRKSLPGTRSIRRKRRNHAEICGIPRKDDG